MQKTILFKSIAWASAPTVSMYRPVNGKYPQYVIDQLIICVKRQLPVARASCVEVFGIERARKVAGEMERLLRRTEYMIVVQFKQSIVGVCLLITGQIGGQSEWSEFQNDHQKHVPSLDIRQPNRKALAIRLFVVPRYQSKGLAHLLMKKTMQVCQHDQIAQLHAIVRYDNWPSRGLFETYRMLTGNPEPKFPNGLWAFRHYVFSHFLFKPAPIPLINSVRIESYFRTLKTYSSKVQHDALKEHYYLMHVFNTKKWVRYCWQPDQLRHLADRMAVPLRSLYVEVKNWNNDGFT